VLLRDLGLVAGVVAQAVQGRIPADQERASAITTS
jgi:hypothetical protein